MVLDHALLMVMVFTSSSVVCPLVGILAYDPESKRKAYEGMTQCVSYTLSNIDHQMLSSLCTREETQAYYQSNHTTP